MSLTPVSAQESAAALPLEGSSSMGSSLTVTGSMAGRGPEVGIDFTESRITELARRYPDNPFATVGYARARSSASIRPLVVEFRSAGQVASCLALLAGGPFVRTLEILSLPVLPPGDFGPSVGALAEKLRVALVNVFPYQSSLERLPAWFPVDWRRTTEEFIWDLAGGPSIQRLHKSARQGVRLSERNGCRLVVGGEELLAAHERSLACSRARRVSRGERPGIAPPSPRMRAFLRTGAGEICQVVDPGGEVHSSALVLRATTGAYLHSMGSSDVGFAIGAAKQLVFRSGERMFGQGTCWFNLGSAATPGLRIFKTLFGAVGRRSEAAVFRIMSRPRQKLLTFGNRLAGFLSGGARG